MLRASGNSPKRRNDIPLLTDNMVFVGSLYDEATEEIKTGNTFWKNGKISLRKSSVKSSSFKFMIEHNILDRLSLFNIDANLKVSFLGGLIEVYQDIHKLYCLKK